MRRESRDKLFVVKGILFFLFFFKIHKQVGSVRKRLLLQLSEAQSTRLQRRRPPPETAARWRCGPLINNLTARYDGKFCISFNLCFDWEARRPL